MPLIDGVDPLTYLLSFLGDDVKLKHIGTLSTLGQHTFENLKPMEPILLIGDGIGTAECYMTVSCLSGSQYWKNGVAVPLGYANGVTRAYSHIIIPTTETVVLKVVDVKNGFTVNLFAAE